MAVSRKRPLQFQLCKKRIKSAPQEWDAELDALLADLTQQDGRAILSSDSDRPNYNSYCKVWMGRANRLLSMWGASVANDSMIPIHQC